MGCTKTNVVLSYHFYMKQHISKTLVWFFPLLLMKNIYPYYTIFLGKRKYYFKSFISYNRYRLVRIISKVARSLYPGGGTHNVVSLLHQKSHRQCVLSQDSDLVHVSTPPHKNIFWIDNKLYFILWDDHWCPPIL